MADLVGQQLGSYRLVRLIGEGGFAEVYLGEHLHLGIFAALKVLSKSLKSVDLERFRLEAQTIARLKHPHIVQVLEFGVTDDIPFLVMEFAPHGTLRTRHPKGTRLSLSTIVPYIQQVADALQYAHGNGIIHRDLKPENLLLGAQDELLLSDFGMALVAQSSQYQATEEIVGTAAYMAPEQIQTHPVPQSDQYALGVMIYEWISGSPPFQGSISEVIAKHLFVAPPSLQHHIPALSPMVEEVVLTALAKDPKARFDSIQALATALEQASRMQQSTLVSPIPSLPPPLAAAASPVTAPPGQAAPAEERFSASWQLAPTQITPPQPEESAPRVERTAPSAPPLTPTVRTATPSTVPAPAPAASKARRLWARGLLVAFVTLVLVSGGLVGLGWVGQHAPTAVFTTPKGATSTPVSPTPKGATSTPVGPTPSPAPGTIAEFAVPTVGSGPFGITAGPDGNLWFTEGNANQIGRITPEGQITEFALSTASSAPAEITAGPDGNLWFTEGNANQIGRITSRGEITEFPLPANSAPDGITAGPDGNLWFTELTGNKIGRITPKGRITEFAVPTPGSRPEDITAGPDGNLWFTEDFYAQIGRITPGGRITEFALPTNALAPQGITAGPDGNLWFTEFGQIGRSTPTGRITEFTLPTTYSVPDDITAGPDGNLWYTEYRTDKIGRITPKGQITEFDLSAGSVPAGITTGPDGTLWFTEYGTDKIGRITSGR